jgi:hypothetical protein
MKDYAKLTTLLFLLIIICLPSVANAQDVLDPIKDLFNQTPGVPDPGGDPDVTVPIDGGLSFLAAAGVAYSMKKIKEYRKNKTENMD